MIIGARKYINRRGFTFIEILIVISIIAILASTIIPNFVGFDAEARVTATKSNLESIRTRINLFRAKEGKYPESLDELTSTYFSDVGVKKPYLKKIPAEMISTSKGNRTTASMKEDADVVGEGGWVYVKDTAEVKVNVKGRLDKKWGDFEDEEPSDW